MNRHSSHAFLNRLEKSLVGSLLACVLVALGSAHSYGEEPPSDELIEKVVVTELPVLTEEDVQELESGELVPGAALFPSLSIDALMEPIEPKKEEPQSENVPKEVPEEVQTEIPEEYLGGYFRARTKRYLLDPQGLLSRQEYFGRERYIQYHADESDFSFYVYLFDTEQIVPDEYGIKKVMNKFYNDKEKSTVLVYYYLGKPDRAQLLFNDKLTSYFFKETAPHTLRESVGQATVKTDPMSQLEAFCIALSLRLRWLERAVETTGQGLSQGEVLGSVQGANKEELVPVRRQSPWNGWPWWGGLFAVIALAALGRWWRLQTTNARTYEFPPVDLPVLLGAPHAAGVGALINFKDRRLPPTKQRKYLFDYLQKI